MNSKTVVIDLIKAASLVMETISKNLKPHGISLPQFNVLRILRGQKGVAANLFTVQERMIHKMSNTTRLIDKLIDKKLVRRAVCEENRRKIELYITAEGLELLQRVDPIVAAVENNFTALLDQESLENLDALLHQLKIN
ncbi:MarR family transcriptional regulator [Flavobacteriaceae bacterium]|jgi:MarR family transcriptional regulator, 2-MHQ and catechol-resistance regulon repressor|nr:MarR family transcriptional regulator [Flavobacteriaceae bacterium]MDA7710948.1 MarR family transcriptional regulator [Flavobacteriaceae bacterium]